MMSGALTSSEARLAVAQPVDQRVIEPIWSDPVGAVSTPACLSLAGRCVVPTRPSPLRSCEARQPRSACRALFPVTVPGLAVDVEQLRKVCGHYGVARLEVFGSVSRGDAEPDSDVDVLYELEPGARLGWDIEKLADELSELLGRRVDLVSRNALHARLHDEVLAEARLLYAA